MKSVSQHSRQPTITLATHVFSIVLLCVITIILFGRTITYTLVDIDDLENVGNNPFIQSLSISNISYIFTHSFANRYVPATMLSYTAETLLFNGSSSGYHVFSVLYHGLNGLLSYWLILLITSNWWIAIIATLLFIVHPNTVEPVVWISAQSSLIGTSLSLASLLCYYYALHKRPSLLFYSTSLVFASLAMLTKPEYVTLPFLFLLLEWWIFRKISRKSLVKLVPVSVVAVIVTIVALHFRGPFHISDATAHFSFIENIILGLSAIYSYTLKLVYPYFTSLYNLFPSIRNGWLPIGTYLTALFVIVLTIIGVYFRRAILLHYRLALFWLLFYLLALVPNVGFIATGNPDYLGERHTYLAYVGACTLLVSIVYKIIGFKKGRLVVLLLAAVYFGLSWQRIAIWKTPETFWSKLIQIDPANTDLYFQYGYYYNHVVHDSTRAVSYYTKALELQPSLTKVLNERGIAYRYLGNYQAALTDYTQAIRIRPGYATAYFNRGILLANYFNDPSGGLHDMTEALKLDSTLQIAYVERGRIYFTQNQLALACKDWLQAEYLGNTNVKVYLSWYCHTE